jgi:outer membrane protein OmpA-like peptidoglycan-associated protein
MAQDPEDVEGGKDTPYFTRMPNFIIEETADKDFGAYVFFDGKKEISIEGKVYQTRYRLKDDAPPTSLLQIRKNYVNAVKSIGGKVLFEGQHDEFEDTRSASVIVTALLTKGSNEAWIEIWPVTDDAYVLTVVERQAMQQVVTATNMLEALNRDGYVTLAIHFDTGTSTIKPESQPILDQIVVLLKENTGLKLRIEGHTDNVGDPKSNKELSNARANAVQSAIVKAGISSTRLSAVGHGQEKPVADNRTEEGKAKNRRVELVKQ